MTYRHGVASNSLDAVLEASGTGKSQLYHYFSDKSDLVAAVIERQLELVLDEQPGLAPVDTWQGLVDWARDRPQPWPTPKAGRLRQPGRR